jgi:ribosomal protein S12 methylthiotransferase
LSRPESPKVYCATLGCDKNLVDSEALLGRFALRGVQAVNDLAEADIWILNSCGFIDAARSDSQETLEQLISMKQGQTLVVCGCWSQEHGQAIQDRYPGVDVVAGVGQFDRVVEACVGKAETPSAAQVAPGKSDFPLAGPPMIDKPTEVHYTGMVDRPLLTPGHLAFVKIGEGCNFSCSFCRIPLIRGTQRSRPIKEILSEVHNLTARGVTEIQIVSQNTSDFGRDTGENLHTLVKELNGVEGLRSIRLLYLYAGLVSVDDLLRLLEMPRVARYLDIPVQHASPRLLRAMRRPGGPESNARFFAALRREHPDLVLRSTALLGFPGEEEDDVSQLADFLAEVEFDHLGTYRYSPEKGTAAADLGDRVPDEVILDREALIMDLQSEISQGRQAQRLGHEHEIVIDRIIPAAELEDEGMVEMLESFAEGQWAPGADEGEPEEQVRNSLPVAMGRSYHFGYDLDGVVLLPAGNLQVGQWVRTRFVGATPYDIWARKL